MTQYHKIQSVFKRDPNTKFKTLLEGEYSIPEFEYLKDNEWVFTEKVDGEFPSEPVVHDRHTPDPTLAFALSRLQPPDYPVPIGVFRDVEAPVLERGIWDQVVEVQKQRGGGDLDALLNAGETWEVKEGTK